MLSDCDRWLCMAVYRQDPAGHARLYCFKQHDPDVCLLFSKHSPIVFKIL